MTEPLASAGSAAGSDKGQGAPAATASAWFGHPPGLTVLFLTNMWEQFSYYGMRALLVYYMTKQLLLPQAQASFVYGTYTACAYLTPILGGVLADRYLGKRRAVTTGATVMAIGHFMMAFEPLFYAALATIALGNGLFLPSLPSQVGDLYRPGDPRRGWAYNVYYLGVNVGGFLAPLVCGTLGEIYGWHYGFGAAGLGMVAGLLIYRRGGHHLPPDEPRRPAPDAGGGQDGRAAWGVLACVAACVVVFRGAYEQVGNTLVLWADTGVDRRVGATMIPMTWFQSLNPLLVMVMTPPLLAWWGARARAGRAESPARRMASGALVVAGAWLLLAAVTWGDVPGERSGWPWLVLFFAVFTLGELFILPTGLGLFARLAPPRLGSTTVAAWFLTIFAGSLTAGWVGSYWMAMAPAAFFALLSGIATAAAVLLRLLGARVDEVAVGRNC